jgi:hypothetical protein
LVRPFKARSSSTFFEIVQSRMPDSLEATGPTLLLQVAKARQIRVDGILADGRLGESNDWPGNHPRDHGSMIAVLVAGAYSPILPEFATKKWVPNTATAPVPLSP